MLQLCSVFRQNKSNFWNLKSCRNVPRSNELLPSYSKVQSRTNIIHHGLWVMQDATPSNYMTSGNENARSA
jgi:hypothetical protein